MQALKKAPAGRATPYSHAERARFKGGEEVLLRHGFAPRHRAEMMRILLQMTTTITHWREPDGRYLGYLNAYPDHWTQGEDLSDLKEQLRDFYQTFTSEDIPGIRKAEQLDVA
jgi:predicted RNase H-like HicB family nuclease